MASTKSRAVSAQYRNTCPVCNAGFREPCRTLKTRRVTDTHSARVQAQFERKVRVIPTPVPDPPVSYLSRYNPVQRSVTQRDIDRLAMAGYARSIALDLLTEA